MLNDIVINVILFLIDALSTKSHAKLFIVLWKKKKRLKYLKNNNNYKSSKSIKLIIRFFSVIKIVITCTIKIQSYILYEIYMYDFYVRVTWYFASKAINLRVIIIVENSFILFELLIWLLLCYIKILSIIVLSIISSFFRTS